VRLYGRQEMPSHEPTPSPLSYDEGADKIAWLAMSNDILAVLIGLRVRALKHDDRHSRCEWLGDATRRLFAD
jgi:hypothetical protein